MRLTLLCYLLSAPSNATYTGEMIIAVDINTGSVFCNECEDFIYNPQFDLSYRIAKAGVNEKNTHFQGKLYPCARQRAF